MLSELNHFSQSLHHGPTKEGTKQNGSRSREGIKAVLGTTTWIGTGKGAQAPEPWGPSLHRGARSCPSPQEAKFNPRGGPAQGLPPPAPTRPLLGRMGGRKARGKAAAAAGGQQGRPFPAPAPCEAQSSGRSCWGTSGASGGLGGPPPPRAGGSRGTRRVRMQRPWLSGQRGAAAATSSVAAGGPGPCRHWGRGAGCFLCFKRELCPREEGRLGASRSRASRSAPSRTPAPLRCSAPRPGASACRGAGPSRGLGPRP